jgi:hypothetical protein
MKRKRCGVTQCRPNSTNMAVIAVISHTVDLEPCAEVLVTSRSCTFLLNVMTPPPLNATVPSLHRSQLNPSAEITVDSIHIIVSQTMPRRPHIAVTTTLCSLFALWDVLHQWAALSRGSMYSALRLTRFLSISAFCIIRFKVLDLFLFSVSSFSHSLTHCLYIRLFLRSKKESNSGYKLECDLSSKTTWNERWLSLSLRSNEFWNQMVRCPLFQRLQILLFCVFQFVDVLRERKDL